MIFPDLKEFLDEKAVFYNRPEFIETDPVRIPHSFSGKENIEISGFLTSTIAWGNRVSIIRHASRLMRMMDNQPSDFIRNASAKELGSVADFYYRTFNGTDALFFLRSLRNIYMHYGGLEKVFTEGFREGQSVKSALYHFRKLFLETAHEKRSCKHLPDVENGSAAKRLNLFLRWMVRNDGKGVDFGIWKGIPASGLMLPFDVHTSRTARNLGILMRKQNDWKAVEEVTSVLREFDPADPVRYDFALFGLGVWEKLF
jgi:uncharacterized protein (TIGR02757 family)